MVLYGEFSAYDMHPDFLLRSDRISILPFILCTQLACTFSVVTLCCIKVFCLQLILSLTLLHYLDRKTVQKQYFFTWND